MSLQRTIQAILILGLSGCSVIDYQAPPAPVNPFDEAGNVQPGAAQKKLPPKTIPKGPSAIAMLPEQADDVAVPIPAPTNDSPLLTTKAVSAESGPGFVIEGRTGQKSLADEIYDEGMRVGASGDFEAEMGLLEQSAAMGNGVALYELAKMYQRGIGVPVDMQESISYLNRAQRLGHVESNRVLGTLYLTGQGVTTDVEYGKTLLDLASETSIRAMREYGQYLGNLRKPYLNDTAKAESLLRRAADQGDGESAKLLATLLGRQGATVATTANRSFAEPGTSSLKAAPTTESGETAAEAVKSKALSGDLEAAYQYGLNVQLRKFPSVEPEFDSYCWYGAAANLGLAKAKVELGSIEGAKKLADRQSPGRMDNCIASLVDVMKQ